MQKFPVSLVIITLNEEKNIRRAIESAPFCEEVVVLDSGSTDKTVAVATECGAKVFVEDFRGFRAQKERAAELAKNPWILSLDADEALSPELREEIVALLASQEFLQRDGWQGPRLSYHMGRWIHHGGWYPDLQLRFYNKFKCRWVGGHVHERVEGTLIGQLKHPIHHWVFRDLTHQVSTNNLYSSYGALDLFDRGTRFSVFRLLTKPMSKFVETYFAKLGFLDGLEGFIVSVGAAYSVFLKFSKLRELERKTTTRDQMVPPKPKS